MYKFIPNSSFISPLLSTFVSISLFSMSVVCFWFLNKFICIFFFKILHISDFMWCLSFSDLLHLVWPSPGPSMLLPVALSHSFLWQKVLLDKVRYQPASYSLLRAIRIEWKMGKLIFMFFEVQPRNLSVQCYINGNFESKGRSAIFQVAIFPGTSCSAFFWVSISSLWNDLLSLHGNSLCFFSHLVSSTNPLISHFLLNLLIGYETWISIKYSC